MGRFFKGRDIAGLPPRFFGYCAVDQTRRRFCQRRWPRTPATPPIANRADRIFETLKKCGLNWGVSVLRRAVEKAVDWHVPLSVRGLPRERNTTPRASGLHVREGGDAGAAPQPQ